ncbi:MAG: DUF3098 domain-containing protein [Bacteroidetes bacterium]|nr:DUF3098 domain-containing protein [Bacteroidota bacterium]MDA0903752.1 DUF3098 domain-containing protein [Bacteroidota bacterium]MDA1242428.1 DUF3098 domain-containing protein [Bacteroidota bacterium]
MNTDAQPQFAFNRSNYTWLGVGIGLLIVGYLLMSGGGSEDPEIFDPSIFSARRISLAPIVVLAGYGVIFYAILKKS